MKRMNLDQMKNMSIDNLIELYRDGYRLEEHTPISSLSNLTNFSNIHTLQGPLLDPVVNFGKVTVSTGYDAAATSIILNTNEGSKLPVPSVSGAFNLVWWNSTDYPDPSDDPNKEIVRCTAKITDTLTITRPQEGTSASVKNIAGKTYKMILSPTAKMISDISSAITARVVKSGDTMTGTLNLPSNGLIVGTNQLIVSGGNVGIGTDTPTVTLTVKGPGTGIIQMTQNPSFTNYGLISLNGTADNTNYNITSSPSDKNLYFNRPTGNAIIFRENNISTPSQMSIIPGGNVGIGTIGPISKLDVQVDTDAHISFGNTGAIPSGDGYLRLGYDGINEYGWISPYLGGTGIKDLILQPWGGNVGIGTTAPGYPLHIYRPSGYTEMKLESDANGKDTGLLFDVIDTTYGNAIWKIGVGVGFAGNGFGIYEGSPSPGTRMVVTSGGNVGIGTTSPGGSMGGYRSVTKLDIVGTTTQSWLRIATGTTGEDVTAIWLHPYDFGNAGWIMGTNNDGKLRLGYGSSTSEEGALGTAKDGSSGITIQTNGNIGIGTTSPGTTLELVLNTSGGFALGQGKLYLSQGGDANHYIQYTSSGITYYDNTAHLFQGSNVGIGTTNPTAKLHIGGTAGVDGIKFPDGTTQTTAATLTRPKTTGSFPGNGATNRAIAHGLGIVPFQVMLWDGLRTVIIRYKNAATPVCQNNHVENGGVVDTTLWDATYFYVTGATEGGNTSGATEYWTAYA